jgi:hypothetical protein
MKLSEVREVIRQVIAEAKAEGGLPKSGGKLVHLKKEMEGLKKMKESLGQLQIAEGGDQQFVAEFAHMQKFVNELEKIKAAHAKLSEMLDNQINEVDGKIKSETEKVKEMMGLIEKAPKAPKAKKDAKKADKKEDKKEEPKAEEKKEDKELSEGNKGDITVIVDYNTDADDIKYVSNILKKAGIVGKVKAGIDSEEVKITINQADKAKLVKALRNNGLGVQ